MKYQMFAVVQSLRVCLIVMHSSNNNNNNNSNGVIIIVMIIESPCKKCNSALIGQRRAEIYN